MLRFLTLAVAVAHATAVRRKRANPQAHTILTPNNPKLPHVGVILNPGGGVDSKLYVEHMKIWQQEAEKVGMAMFVSVLDYWFDVPIPINLKKNVVNSLSLMANAGMSQDAPVYISGHSMGGGVCQDVAQEMLLQGELAGQILLAAYIRAERFPPMAASYNYTVPTMTIGAELNWGAGRITRLTAAAYRQEKNGLNDREYPFVIVEGMNHMQFATGFAKADLKPEKSWEQTQTEVAKLVAAWLSERRTSARSAFLGAELSRTKKLIAPLIAAFELEGSANFNVPNQKGAPNNACPRGVCPTSSPWSVIAQKHILGNAVLKSEVQINDHYADLNPWTPGPRDDRKPTISEDLTTVNSFVMSAATEGEFEQDVKIPVATTELLGKYVSRQAAKLKLLDTVAEKDGDLCMELNEKAYRWARTHASDKALARFEAHGTPMEFAPTVYKGAGPLWVSAQMQYEETDSTTKVTSAGLFTEPGDRSSKGNHYCKLLSPARAMEYIYVDGLKNSLYGVWTS